jgi:hypothetical protein
MRDVSPRIHSFIGQEPHMAIALTRRAVDRRVVEDPIGNRVELPSARRR